MATAVATPTTAKTTTSVDPLYTEALAQAKAALAAQQAPIQSEQAQSDSAFKQRQTDASGEASALSDLLKGIGPAVSGEYSSAAQNQGLLANGFSQGMQDALQGNTDNLNAMLKQLGAPAQIDSHAQEAGDVTYGTGGFIPGSSFAKTGAAMASAADMLPATALLRGQDEVKSLRSQAISADQGFQNKLAEMAGNLPGDVETNYKALQTLALDNAKFREQVRRDNIEAASKQAMLKLDYLKYSTGVKEFNARQQLDYAKLAQSQANSDRTYGLNLAKLGIAQQRLQQTIIANSFKAANGGLTKTQVNKFTSVAQSIAMKSYYGSTKVTTTSGTLKSTSNVGAVSYAEGLQNILSKGVPVQIALDALDRVYPANQRPTPAILAKVLGPLDPQALKQVAAGLATPQGINNPHVDSVATQPYKDYAFSQFSKYGWSAQDAQALDSLWQSESGWNPNAANKGSGAAGIPQELGHNVPPDYATNPQTQINWGLNYIKSTYGTPQRAWAFWQATVGRNAALAPSDLRAKAQQWISKHYAGY